MNVFWEGAYAYNAGGPAKFGVGVGGVGYTFVLWSDCDSNGKRVAVAVDASAGVFGVGVSSTGPIAMGASTVKFDDTLSTANPDVFNGDFSVGNLGGLVYSITPIIMGGAIGNGTGLNVSTSYIDFSFARGKSKVRGSHSEDCICLVK